MLSILQTRRQRHREVPELLPKSISLFSGRARIWTQALHSFIHRFELLFWDRHGARDSQDHDEHLELVLHRQIGLSRVWLQTFPDLQWFSVWFFYFMMVQKQYSFSRNHTSNFDLSLGSQCVVRYSLVMLGSGLEPRFPVSHAINKGSTADTLTTILYPDNHCFSLLVQCSINYIRYSTL